MSIQKRNKLFLYIINLTIGMIKNYWDLRVKKIHSLTINSSSRDIPSTYQTISIYHWIYLFEHLIPILNSLCLKSNTPLFSPQTINLSLSLLLSHFPICIIKMTLFVHLSHFLPHCQSITCQISFYFLKTFPEIHLFLLLTDSQTCNNI